MSAPSLLFACYFIIGLILMVVAVATRGKDRRAKYLDVSDGSQVGAGLMIFIALLWPLWLIALLAKDDKPKR
jgi:hypothetical protein